MTNTMLYLGIATSLGVNVALPEGKTSEDIASMVILSLRLYITFNDGTEVYYNDVITEIEPDGDYCVKTWRDESEEAEVDDDDDFAQPIEYAEYVPKELRPAGTNDIMKG